MKGDELKQYGSVLEEARADLFSLYYMADPKMEELGLLPDAEVAKAQYASYISNGMMTQASHAWNWAKTSNRRTCATAK